MVQIGGIVGMEDRDYMKRGVFREDREERKGRESTRGKRG